MSSINRLIEMDHEVGRANSPPKLLKIEDYYWWRERFESFARYHDMRMWICIEDGYVAPTETVNERSVVYTYARMSEENKKIYEAENRALSCIKMCLPQDILHTFRNQRSSKELWEALEKRYSGNTGVRKGRMESLKRQFAVFNYMKNESLDDTVTRYYHLLTELDSHGVIVTDTEKKDRFLGSLPAKWNMHVMLMKSDETKYATISLEDAIDNLKASEYHMQRQESCDDSIQNPEMYYAKPSKPTTSSSGGVTAFFSGDSDVPRIIDAEGNYISSTGVNDQGKTPAPTTSTSTPKTTHEHKGMSMSASKAEEQLAILASFLVSYENYIQGKLNDPAIFDEDYDQIDPDDQEEMDLQYLLAMVARKAKRFMNRTGRNLVGGKPGFDKSKVRCFNCQGMGHFARECQRPKVERTTDEYRQGYSGNQKIQGQGHQSYQKAGTGTSNSSSSNALVVQQLDGSYDWSVHSSESERPPQAFMVDVIMTDDGLIYEEAEESSERNMESDDRVAADNAREEKADSDVLVIEKDKDQSIQEFVAQMANVTSDKKKVCLDLISVVNVCNLCIDQQANLGALGMSIASLNAELQSLKEDNVFLKANNKELLEKAKSDSKDITVLKDTINEQSVKTDLVYGNVEDLTKQMSLKEKELADAKVKIVELNRKFEQFRTSSLNLNTVIDSQRCHKNVGGLGYNEVAPPFNHNYASYPSVKEIQEANEANDTASTSSVVSDISGKRVEELITGVAKFALDDSSESENSNVLKISEKENVKTAPQKSLKHVQFVASVLNGKSSGPEKVKWGDCDETDDSDCLSKENLEKFKASSVKSDENVLLVSSGVGSSSNSFDTSSDKKTNEKVSKKPIERISCFRCHERGHFASCCPNKKTVESAPKQVSRSKTPVRQKTPVRSEVQVTSSVTPSQVSESSSSAKPGQGVKNKQIYQPIAKNTDQTRRKSPFPNNFRKPEGFQGSNSQASGNRSLTPKRFQTPNRNQNRFSEKVSTSRQGSDYREVAYNYDNSESRVQHNSRPRFQRPVPQRVDHSNPREGQSSDNVIQPRDKAEKSKSPNKKRGYLREIAYTDDNGKPKTVMAWVPLDD